MPYLRHVHVVNEDEQSLGRGRAVRVLGAFLHVGLQTALHVQRGGATGEVQVHQHLQHASLRSRMTTTTTRFVSKSTLSNICFIYIYISSSPPPPPTLSCMHSSFASGVVTVG